jgi:hypothetical protein
VISAATQRHRTAEGPQHVAGRYIADPHLAADARRLAAERAVRETARAAATPMPTDGPRRAA